MPGLSDYDKRINEEIAARVFEAVDKLLEKGKIKEKQEFFDQAGVFRSSFLRIQRRPDLRMPLTVIHALVDRYKVSAKWLITGKK